MAREKIIGVYKIENIINNKVYIGSSQDVKDRWNQHKRQLKKNEHHSILLQRSWNKNSEYDFKFSIIIECEVKDLLKNEQYWMDYYKSYNSSNGYNILPIAGSTVGREVSQETRLKISLMFKTRKPICQIDIKGNIIKEWRGIGEIQKDLTLDNRNIKKSLLHKSYKNIWNDYFWVYKDEYEYFNLNNFKEEIESYLFIKNKQYEIVQLSLDNVLPANRQALLVR